MDETRLNVKASVLEVLDTLPDDVSWRALMYALYVRSSIEEGLASVEAGRTVPHSEVLRHFGIGHR
jgi:hypothetical protein